jgi:hypothetical protein
MARVTHTFDVLREIGLALPGVVETRIHGVPALKAGGKLLACVPVHKSAEPNCAMVRIDMDRRKSLISASPDIYYVTDHYAGYPTVLVRLPRISRRELQALLGHAWSFAAVAKRPRGASTRSKPAARSAKGEPHPGPTKRQGRQKS